MIWTAEIQIFKWRYDELQFKQLQIHPKKKVRDFNGIRTHGLCVSAAVL